MENIMRTEIVAHAVQISNEDMEGLLLMRTAASLLAREALRLKNRLEPWELPNGYQMFGEALEKASGFWRELDFYKQKEGL
jgi:hypothetical protein